MPPSHAVASATPMAEHDVYLTMAAFVQATVEEVDGTYSLLHVFDRLEVSPAQSPTGQSPTVAVVLVLCFRSDDAQNTRTVLVTPTSPSGERLGTVPAPLTLRPPALAEKLVVTVRLPLEEEGKYWFDVSVEASTLARLPLLVTKRPESTTTGTPSPEKLSDPFGQPSPRMLTFPVLAEVGGSTLPRAFEVYGTAFPLGGDLLMTANHVIENVAATKKALLLGFVVGEDVELPNLRVCKASLVHRWPDVDLAVFRAPGLRLNPLNWRASILPVFHGVRTTGYAFGMNREALLVAPRGFTGSVVVSRPFERFPGQPWIYEVSFAAPRGLSGAPLFLSEGPTVSGCIIGNSETKMLVFSSAELLKAEGETVRLEQYEALTLGVVVRADEILKQVIEPFHLSVEWSTFGSGAGKLPESKSALLSSQEAVALLVATRLRSMRR